MASTCFTPLLPLSFCFLLLFHGGLAWSSQQQQQHRQQTRLSGPSDCRIDRITAREPNRRVQSEAGISEFWVPEQNDELECAGIEAARHTINPKGLLLPYYPNAPELVYVVQGSGIQGTVLPGCPDTFETTFGSGGEVNFDRHHRVYRYKEGDILALPAGSAHWTYNDGDRPIVTVVLRDTSNVANQLDRNFRKFFLAGNPQGQQERERGSRRQEEEGHQGGRRQDEPRRRPGQEEEGGRQGGRKQDEPRRRPGQEEEGGRQGGRRQDEPRRRPGQEEEGHQGGRRRDEPRRRPGQRGEQGQEGSNIFSGFGDEILQEVFNVESNIVRQLKGEDDNRGLIVNAEDLQVVAPEQEQEGSSPRRGGGRDNGIEETLCSTQLRANIANPARADIYNPRGGRIHSLNSYDLPILNLLQLSAERGVLYKNAVHAPYYNLNAHSVLYILSGNSRLQIVRNDGSTVFDDVVREGQLIVVPQNFAVVKKAGEQGCEWVAFKTNENAITTPLAGRYSVIRALPEEVVANSYDISREQAKKLKYNRQEGVVLSPTSGSSRQKGMNAVLNVLFS